MVLTIENMSVFAQTIQTSSSQIPSVLADFQKYYVMYHKNPEVNEFQNFFSNSKSQLTNINNSLFATQTSLEKNISQLETEMRAMSKKIDIEKQQYGLATTSQYRLANAKDGANQLIEDSQHLYNIQYIKNIEIIAGVIVVIKMLVKCI